MILHTFIVSKKTRVVNILRLVRVV